jgi:histidinol-phosphatase (PHP family)
VGPYEKNPKFFKPEPWYEEIQRLRSNFNDQLIIRAGIEIAEPHLYPSEAAEVLSRVPFDYVIGSVHWVGPLFMFDSQYFSNGTADDIYNSYFDELERMVENADIDIVAHFDIPARTAIPILGYEPVRYERKIRSILDIIIHRNLALDINAAGLRKASQNLMPDPVILKWYVEMNGQQVTLGSDAHRMSEVGQHLDLALKAIRSAGLTQITQFRHRQGCLVALE